MSMFITPNARGFSCMECFCDSNGVKDPNKIAHMPGCRIQKIEFCTICPDGGDVSIGRDGNWHCPEPGHENECKPRENPADKHEKPKKSAKICKTPANPTT